MRAAESRQHQTIPHCLLIGLTLISFDSFGFSHLNSEAKVFTREATGMLNSVLCPIIRSFTDYPYPGPSDKTRFTAGIKKVTQPFGSATRCRRHILASMIDAQGFNVHATESHLHYFGTSRTDDVLWKYRGAKRHRGRCVSGRSHPARYQSSKVIS